MPIESIRRNTNLSYQVDIVIDWGLGLVDYYISCHADLVTVTGSFDLHITWYSISRLTSYLSIRFQMQYYTTYYYLVEMGV
jgi:hypothetical protein